MQGHHSLTAYNILHTAFISQDDFMLDRDGLYPPSDHYFMHRINKILLVLDAFIC